MPCSSVVDSSVVDVVVVVVVDVVVDSVVDVVPEVTSESSVLILMLYIEWDHGMGLAGHGHEPTLQFKGMISLISYLFFRNILTNDI